MAPNHDERIEIRAPSAEVERWRRFALNEGLALSEWLRKRARSAASPSAVQVLLNDLREHIERHQDRYPQHQCILSLTIDDERTLMRAARADLSEPVFARLLLEGARRTFKTLFGARTEWGEKNRGSRPHLDNSLDTQLCNVARDAFHVELALDHPDTQRMIAVRDLRSALEQAYDLGRRSVQS